ncbi:MAG: hypothetical protein M3452_08660 [Chloroflexota bacterium]|nr:hypothetical protein [Chloroflexota bacterium]
MDEHAKEARATIDPREAELLTELLRLVRIDADIMESVRDMVRVAGQEAARRPGLMLQAPAASSHEGDLLGGQGSISNPLGQLLDLVKDEKKFVQELIIRILRL